VLVKILEFIHDDYIVDVEIPMAIPMVYTLSRNLETVNKEIFDRPGKQQVVFGLAPPILECWC